jgi:peptidyl-tRNA hydrolase, PTH1 family
VGGARAARSGARFRRSWRARAQVAKGAVAGQETLLVKPQTYMNNSGHAVTSLLRWYRLRPQDLVVVVDDAELPTGRLRLRPKGSAGHHNGLKSVVRELGTEEFVRLRVGVGAAEGNDMVDHVLSGFGASERETMERAIGAAADALACLVREGVDAAMNQFNRQ